jgi:hypothetical protein
MKFFAKRGMGTLGATTQSQSTTGQPILDVHTQPQTAKTNTNTLPPVSRLALTGPPSGGEKGTAGSWSDPGSLRDFGSDSSDSDLGSGTSSSDGSSSDATRGVRIV